jgi:hypothetical protein
VPGFAFLAVAELLRRAVRSRTSALKAPSREYH